MELTNSLFREDPQMWPNDLAMQPDLQDMLGPEQGYEGLYGTRPSFHQQGYDQIPIDSMQGLEIGSGFGMEMDIGEADAGGASAELAFPEPPHDNNNVAAWYDTDL
ncbi:armadillo segment polarity protein-like [Ostrinia furnacalis]|nr:armadillo segment polarity protein-like [Ostrinia furnacalis]